MSPARASDMESVREVLRDEFARFLDTCYFTPNDPAYFTLLASRFDKKVLRGYYVTLMIRYIEAETKQPVKIPKYVKERVLPFVAEVLMVVMYYDNQILDRKAGVNTHRRQCDNLLQSNILLSELSRYLQHRVRNQRLCQQIRGLVRDVYEIVNIGQQIEQTCNLYPNWKNNIIPVSAYRNLPYDEAVIAQTLLIINSVGYIPQEKQAFLEMYIRRVYLTNAYLFVRFTDLIADLAPGLSVEKRADLTKFAGLSGLALQIVNDVIDFVPSGHFKGTQAKDSGDAMSDLRNENITLPLIFHLSKGRDSVVERYLEELKHGKSADWNDEIYLCQAMLKSKAISHSKKCARELREIAIQKINAQNLCYRPVMDHLSMVLGNTFYITLSDISKNKKIKYHPTYSI